MFTIEFPEGARVYNAITGFFTEGGRVWNPRLESIIDKSIEALDISDTAPGIMSSSEQSKQEPEAKDSQQTTTQASPNEPVPPTNEDTSKMLMDVYPGDAGGLSVVWILLPTFLAAFALTAVVLIFHNRSRNMKTRDVK